MCDWACLYQPNDGPDDCGGRDTLEQYEKFKGGLGVMGNAYASPRVLVIQQRELPDDGESHHPYERSGWCQFESHVSALVTVDGGHAVELGGGRVRVQEGARSKSAAEMRRDFPDFW